MSAVSTKNRVVVSMFLTAAVAVTSSLAFAANGGANGGGGDVTLASEQQIKDAVNPKLLEQAFQIVGRNMKRIQDPELQSLLETMFDFPNSGGVFKDIKETPIRFSQAPCLGADAEGHEAKKQASVEENRLYSPICFSLSRLQIPASGVKRAMISLYAHEIAHHYTADEKLAKKAEELFRSWPSDFSTGLVTELNQGTLRALETSEAFASTDSFSRGHFCSQLSQAYGMLYAISATIRLQANYDSSSVVPDLDEAKLASLVQHIWHSVKTCEELKSEEISERTRKAFVEDIENGIQELKEMGLNGYESSAQ